MMKKRWLLAVLFLLAVGLPAFDAAAASRAFWQRRCREMMTDNPPKIEVFYNYGNLTYDLSRSSDEIAGMLSEKTTLVGGATYYGLTEMNQYNVLILTDSGPQLLGDGFYCIYPVNLSIRTGYMSPKIYLSSAMKKDSCLYKKTLRHEQQHVDLAYISLNMYIDALNERAGAIVKDIGPILVKGKTPKRTLLSMYKERFDMLYDIFYQGWRKRSKAMDTPENYNKESAICH